MGERTMRSFCKVSGDRHVSAMLAASIIFPCGLAPLKY
jgi:hypothetical protein